MRFDFRLHLVLYLVACSSAGPGSHVATLPSLPVQIAADSDAIFTILVSGELYRVDVRSGALALLVRLSDPNAYVSGRKLGVGSGNVFVAKLGTSGAILSIPRGGGTLQTVVTEPNPTGLFADDSRLYYLDLTSPDPPYPLRTLQISGGSPVDFGTGDAIALASDAVYWTAGTAVMGAAKANLSAVSQIGQSTAPAGVLPFAAFAA